MTSPHADFDAVALHRAVDARRVERKLTWKALAAKVGCRHNQLTGLRTVQVPTGMRLAMRITLRLGKPAAPFVSSARW